MNIKEERREVLGMEEERIKDENKNKRDRRK